MTDPTSLFDRLAAAYVRGGLAGAPASAGDLRFTLPLDELSDDQRAELVRDGRAAGFPMYRFKRTMGLPWVTRVLGILRALAPSELPFSDGQFDVVTLLEVLEHIPDTASALREVLRVARRFVILTVPSKPDENPEHVHLFSADRLQSMLTEHGARRVTFERVPGHLIAVVGK